mmetsp:Transcript_68883/g.224443  ORF Transcript_68883/g.224443 Transcript_68883/m.224443 type:complete len:214 (-) Transcript_68883:687-1328(-)
MSCLQTGQVLHCASQRSMQAGWNLWRQGRSRSSTPSSKSSRQMLHSSHGAPGVARKGTVLVAAATCSALALGAANPTLSLALSSIACLSAAASAPRRLSACRWSGGCRRPAAWAARWACRICRLLSSTVLSSSATALPMAAWPPGARTAAAGAAAAGRRSAGSGSRWGAANSSSKSAGPCSKPCPRLAASSASNSACSVRASCSSGKAPPAMC